VNDVEQSLIDLLKSITPKAESLNLFIALLRKTYMKRLSLLKKKKDEADIELGKLYSLRQSLIEKNLSGVYSDDIFKEQNAVIEDKILVLRIAKDEDLINQYNLEEIFKFVKGFFVDLGETYRQSSLIQKRALLGSIFASKLSWSYPGYSNRSISPSYQYIRYFSGGSAPVGDPAGARTPNQELKRLLLYH
jgi:hypothetical protein